MVVSWLQPFLDMHFFFLENGSLVDSMSENVYVFRYFLYQSTV